eukprot:CAMPEP_0180278234 /NCGR_PEP_ID=MMETSP0988-20121125/7370_1 /TAXON_ID=697907 /ORGANISM="non described non described, Strain CCMP2293" /LENGTH=209 /DNA_ID=CAMNT_0022249759 /DNA_START=33 /DNA_END=663 /DNA_ORIENTATION=-
MTTNTTATRPVERRTRRRGSSPSGVVAPNVTPRRARPGLDVFLDTNEVLAGTVVGAVVRPPLVKHLLAILGRVLVVAAGMDDVGEAVGPGRVPAVLGVLVEDFAAVDVPAVEGVVVLEVGVARVLEVHERRDRVVERRVDGPGRVHAGSAVVDGAVDVPVPAEVGTVVPVIAQVAASLGIRRHLRPTEVDVGELGGVGGGVAEKFEHLA